MKILVLFIFIYSGIHCSFSQNNSYETECPLCDSVVKIDFYYSGWDYHPIMDINEYKLRNHIDVETREYTLQNTDTIRRILSQYFDCNNRNYGKDLEPEHSIVMVVDIIYKSGDKNTIRISRYLQIHDRYGENYHNIMFIAEILKYVPNNGHRLSR